MLDAILDFVAVFSPIAIAWISVHIGKKLSQNSQDQSHHPWWRAIIVLGIICSIGTLWQQQRSRQAHAQEIKDQKADNARLQSSLDNMNGQMTAFGIVLSKTNQNGSLDVQAISEAMKKISQSAQLKTPKSEDVNRAIRTKLGQLLEEYYEIKNMRCSPPQIGLPHSGAAETVESCNQLYAAWSLKASTYICGSGELEATDCTEYRWTKSSDEKKDAVEKLIERYRKIG